MGKGQTLDAICIHNGTGEKACKQSICQSFSPLPCPPPRFVQDFPFFPCHEDVLMAWPPSPPYSPFLSSLCLPRFPIFKGMTLIIREAEGGSYPHGRKGGEENEWFRGRGKGDKFGDHFFVSPFWWTGCLSGLKEGNPKYAYKNQTSMIMTCPTMRHIFQPFFDFATGLSQYNRRIQYLRDQCSTKNIFSIYTQFGKLT